MKKLLLSLIVLMGCKDKGEVPVVTEFDTGPCSGWDISKEFDNGKVTGNCELTVNSGTTIFVGDDPYKRDEYVLTSQIKILFRNTESFKSDERFYDKTNASLQVLEAPKTISDLAELMETDSHEIVCSLSYATYFHINCDTFLIILGPKL